jgi:CubicO group peptidase (beta-lactamase class C family)
MRETMDVPLGGRKRDHLARSSAPRIVLAMMKSFLRRRALLVALLSIVAACGRAATSATPAASTSSAASYVYPSPSWERWSRPEDAGYRSNGLDSVRAMLSKLPSTGMVAVVGGKELMQYGDLRAVSYLASVRKSVLSAIIGNYVASGKIRLNKTLAEIGIDDKGGLTASEKEATVLDLLTARSGVYHEASNSGDDLASAPPRGSQKHGTYQLYSNWDFNALGSVFEKETGRNIYDAVDTDLAKPIGMEDWDRASQRKSGDTTKSIHLAYHMNFSTRDMARIGYLMLREGNWAGKQVIPRNWVRESTRAFTPVSEMNPPSRRTGRFGYGYLWWVWDGKANTGPYRGAYTGLGAVGQHIAVLPALDLVVAHKTRPNQAGGSVSHEQFMRVLDQLVQSRCPDARCN